MLPLCLGAQPYRTIAGNDTLGYNGDVIAATAARLNAPSGVATDAAGNIYIADFGNNRIRKITPEGTIYTIAGTASGSYSGDGWPAYLAELYHPYGIAVAPSGNIYFSDQGNNRIRKIDAGGYMSTIAGTGYGGYNSDNIPATAAMLNAPAGIALDKYENVYVADYSNKRIRKIDGAGMITTVAGNGNAIYSGDGGPAIAASLGWPQGVAVDTLGNIFIADTWNNHIRKVNVFGFISNIGGKDSSGHSGDGGPATNAKMWHPAGIAVDAAGNVLFTDMNNSVVRMITPNGTIQHVTGSPFLGPGYQDYVMPKGICIDGHNNIFVAFAGSHIVKTNRAPLAVPLLTSVAGATVFPNPAKDVVHINGIQNATSYRLLNVTGATMLQGSLQPGNNTLTIQALPRGMYLLEAGGDVVKVIVAD